MIASRPVTTVIAVALLTLGAVSGAQSTVSAHTSAVATGSSTDDSGWGSTKPPVETVELRTASPTDDSGWG